MHWRTGAMAALTFTLAACAYTVERRWTYTFNLSSPRQSFEARALEADEAKKHFSDTLRDCVSKFDPGHLVTFDETREYQISGWFVDSDRTGPVIRCMSEKGWIAVPTTLLAP